jgi:hypothetical protein
VRPAEAEEQPVAVDVLAHLRGLRPQVLPALVVAVVAGVVAFLVSSSRAPVYEATVSGWVETGSEAGSAPDAAIRLEWTLAAVALASGEDVLDDAVSAAGTARGPGDAVASTSAARNPDNGALLVRVLGPSPEDAARIADELLVVLDDRLAARQRATVTDLVDVLQEQVAAVDARLARLPAGAAGRAGLQAERDALLGQIADVRRDEPAAALTSLAPATATPGAIAPRPAGTAATVALVALVLAAEVLLLVRRRLAARRRARDGRASPASAGGSPAAPGLRG